MRRAIHIILALLLFGVVVVSAGFIFSNSLQSGYESTEMSNAVGDMFAPILGRLHRLSLRVCAWADLPSVTSYETFVRKLAHFAEYLALGMACAMLTSLLSKGRPWRFVWADLFVVLAVAVADEFIQTFSDRGSRLFDVLIDFSGALVGVVVVLIIASIIAHFTYKPPDRFATQPYRPLR